ncbi:MAG: sporulation transcriptional regulator SpoIIID [Clostridia bacterium]|nr:sporulation transcriptional regulator SpoIIID [Clostridia bacterium]
MKEYIELRCKMLANYICEKKATVRDASREFGVSKSTVHKDVTTRLRQIDYCLYLQVKDVLEINLKERHIRGGDATRAKYLSKAKKS